MLDGRLSRRDVLKRGAMLGLSAPVIACLLAACAAQPARNPMAEWVPSPNFEPRRPIIIVLHATEQRSVEQSLETLAAGC